MLLKFENNFFNIKNENLNSFIKKTFKLKKKEYIFIKKPFFLELKILLIGGKGGFGRAMKQDGEKRSRKLPPHKDACRTLSGHRIGYLKAKKRIIDLKEKIKIIQEKKELEKEIKNKSNLEKEKKLLEEQHNKIKESVISAITFNIINPPILPNQISNDSIFKINEIEELDNL